MAAHLSLLRLEGAKSEELRSAFACVSEATAVDGTPRYSERVNRRLARMIVSRNYAKATLELSHLLAAVSQNDTRFEVVFWNMEKVSTNAFRHYFLSHRDRLDAVGFFARTHEITWQLNDSKFSISYSRMPFLAAFLDFLLTTIGFAKIDDASMSLRKKLISIDDIQRTANTFQKMIYGYLKEHLPPAHAQRGERNFLDFVETQSGNRSGADAIDDPTVLRYWCHHANDETLDVKTFRSVFDLARRSILALDAATERISAERSKSIGPNRENGEVDPEDIDHMLGIMSPDDCLVDTLQSQCGDLVKIVHGSEVSLMREITVSERVTRRIPISVLRSTVQGERQYKLIAAERRFDSSEDVISDTSDVHCYVARIERYNELLSTLERLTLAALWQLHQAGAPEAISLALYIAPDINWGALSMGGDISEETVDGVVSLSAHRAATQFFATKRDPAGDEVQALLDEAYRTWRKINRRGFTDQESEESQKAMCDATPYFLRLIEKVREFLDRDMRGYDWIALGKEDCATFDSMFKALYGEPRREREHA